MIGKQLLRFNKQQKYVCMDVETMSLNLLGHNNVPWQVSFCVFDQERVHEEHDYYVSWGYEPSPEVQQMTGYSKKRMAEEGRDPTEIYHLFNKYLNNPDYLIVGHNFLGFDSYMTYIWAKQIGQPHSYDFTKRLIDTLALAKAMRFDKKIDRENFLSFQYKMDTLFKRGQKCKLSDLASEFGIPYDPARLHDSSYDILINAEVFKKLIYSMEV